MQIDLHIGWQRRLCRLAMLGCVAFAGCGGGAGGGPGSQGSTNGSGAPNAAGPSSASATPLSVTGTNAVTVGTLAMGYGAVALGLAQTAVDWTAEAEAASGLSVTSACGGGGSRTLTLSDKDSNGKASNGDQLTVSLTRCYLPDLEGQFSGTLTIGYSTPNAPATLAGTLTFGAQFFEDDGSNSSVSVRLAGALRFETSSDRLSKLTRALSVTSQSFLFHASTAATASSAAVSKYDAITALDASREVRRDTARTTVKLSYHLVSDLLGGSLDMSTTAPFASWFGAYPDVGELAVTGSGNAMAVRAANSLSTLIIDLNGVNSNGILVEDASSSFLWSGSGWLPANPNASAPVPLQSSVVMPFTTLTSPADVAQLPSPGTLTWQYSRPLAPLTYQTAILRQTSGKSFGVTYADIPATVSTDGALLSLSPSAQLQPGATYRVLIDGLSTSISDTGGHTTSSPNVNFSVKQTVNAVASVGDPGVLIGASSSLAVDAAASSVAVGAPTATWTQLSGPRLNITGGTTLHAVVSPADVSNGVAVLQLDVRNGAGDVDSARINIPVLADLSNNALVIGMTQDGGPRQVFTNVDAGTSIGYALYYAPNDALDILLAPSNMLLRLLVPKSSLQIGVPVVPPTGGWLPPCPSGGTTQVTLLDFALDTSGKLVRVAADVDQTCSTAPSMTKVSVRYNSTIPLRP